MVTANTKPKIQVGVDPEFFAVCTKKGMYISAHDLVPGSKEIPHALEKGAVQVDGCAIEYNTAPASTALEFVQNNTKVIEQIRAMVPKNIEFKFEPVVYFDKYYFDKIVPANPKELGCSPDYSAWSGAMNPRPIPPAHKATMRTASGHFHIGWTSGANPDDPSHQYDCRLIVRALESVILPWMYVWDTDTQRSSLYGKPGAMRYKSYGVEWRTPSNAWLNHPEIWEWLFDTIVKTVELVFDGKLVPPMQAHRYPTVDGKTTGYSFAPGWGRSAAELYHTSTNLIKYIPLMPKLSNEEEIKLKKSTRRLNSAGVETVRIAPTSRTTIYDVNLDLAQGNGIPAPAYVNNAISPY